MKSGVMGVALAAVMACGWAGTAEASSFGVTGTYLDANGYNGTVAADPGRFGFTYGFQPMADTNAIFTLSGIPNSIVYSHSDFNASSYQISVDFLLINADYMYSVFDSGLGTFEGGRQNFSVDLTYFFEKDLFSQKALLAGVNVTAGPGSLSFYNSVGVAEVQSTVDGFVSTVPLPASAPLFGAALFALGGATYARRRVKAA